MRTLNKNKQKLYKVSLIGTEEATDAFGNYTGELKRIYSVPEEIWINFRTLSGLTTSEIFGNHSDYDMSAISENKILDRDDLLFYDLPDASDDYLKVYDLKVQEVSPSLNSYIFGFRKRV